MRLDVASLRDDEEFPRRKYGVKTKGLRIEVGPEFQANRTENGRKSLSLPHAPILQTCQTFRSLE